MTAPEPAETLRDELAEALYGQSVTSPIGGRTRWDASRDAAAALLPVVERYLTARLAQQQAAIDRVKALAQELEDDASLGFDNTDAPARIRAALEPAR